MKKWFKPQGFGWQIWILSPIFRHFLRFTIRLGIFDVISIGRDNIPKTGPVIIASNHLSFADPICLWGAIRRNAVFMAAKEVWRYFGWFMGPMGHIPVKRNCSISGKKALDKFLGYLKAGGVGIIYPEGTRSRNGELKTFKRGVYYLSLESGAPVVPVGVSGTNQLLPTGGLKINRKARVIQSFGEPMKANDFTSAEAFLTELRLRIQNLSGQELAES